MLLILRQAQAPSAPTAPAPSAPTVPAPTPLPAGVIQVHHYAPPQGADPAAWLQEVGRQLSNQIESARSRRNVIARQYEASTGANRAGLEQQLRILDQRIAQLELDIADVGVQKAQGVSTTSATGFNPGPFIAGVPNALSVIFCFVLLLPISIGIAKRIWKRPAPTLPPKFDDTAARLERVEQAIETIAIEIERVSEGQRYISKILSPQEQRDAGENGVAAGSVELNGAQPLPALGAGSPEPMVLQQERAEVRVRRN
jgi:hypothetical protein